MAQASNGRNCMVQGRIVWTCGNLFAGRAKTIFGTNQPRINEKTGEKMMEYGFGLAVPKSVIVQNMMGPGQPGEIWAAIHAEAMTMFPSGQIPPSFAMKYKDGDGLDDEGKPFSLREGYAQHLVFACTTSIPIKFFKFENGQNILVPDGIKCGDYVNVQLNIAAHPAVKQGKAGLYLNPNAVQFLGYGKEIVNTPSGDQIFGTGMPAIPQGASSVPVAPQGGMLVPTAPAQPQFAQPQQHAPVMPQQPAAPHFGVVPPQFQPPPGGQPMGNVQPQPGYPAPGAPVTPTAAPMPPSFAANVAQPGYPPQWPQNDAPSQYPQQPGYPMPGVPGFPGQQ